MYKKLPRSMKKIVKKIGRIEARIHKKLLCLEPRLKRRYGRLIYPEGLSVRALKEKKINFIKDFIEYVKNGNAEDEEVLYIEDCFDDMERPRFGYSVKLMLKENEPCNINFDNPDQDTCRRRTNNENEVSSRVYTGYFDNNAQSRQTGEEFTSADPPECRIEYCGIIPTNDANDPTINVPVPAPVPTPGPSPVPAPGQAPILAPVPAPAPQIPQTPQLATTPVLRDPDYIDYDNAPPQPAPQLPQTPQSTTAPVFRPPDYADYDNILYDANVPNNLNGDFQRPVYNSRPLPPNDLPSYTGKIPVRPNFENSTPNTLDLYSYPYSKSYALYYHQR